MIRFLFYSLHLNPDTLQPFFHRFFISGGFEWVFFQRIPKSVEGAPSADRRFKFSLEPGVLYTLCKIRHLLIRVATIS